MLNNDYVIVVGGYNENTLDGNIIKLNCDDTYCGLPDKVVSMFKFINENNSFDKYTHFHKLDEDLVFMKDIDFELTDYMGMICGAHMINRNHHIGRCGDHYWNDKPYEGEISDWCEGGISYIVSRKSIDIISKIDGTQFPLEDVMVANTLATSGIYPKFTNIEWYFKGTQWYDKVRPYKDFKGKEWREGGIPKWIFKTGPFQNGDLPEVMKLVYYEMSEKNPGYQLFYFSDDECIEYIRDYYGEDYVRRYNSLVPGAYKADYWRYLILYKHGGCYGDFSQVMLTTFDNLINGVDRVFVRDTPEATFALYNAFMCCKPGDKVLEKVIELVNHRIDNREYGFNTLDVTGPRIFGTAFCDVMQNGQQTDIKIGINDGTKIIDNFQMHGTCIVDENGKNIILKKLHNHFEYLYGNRKHYGQLWHERQVYR